MFNEVFLIGRIVSMPDFSMINNEVKDALMHIEVGRPFNEGMNEKPLEKIPVVLWNGVASMVRDTCQQGSIVAVKGRLVNFDAIPHYEGMAICYVKGESVHLLDHVLGK